MSAVARRASAERMPARPAACFLPAAPAGRSATLCRQIRRAALVPLAEGDRQAWHPGARPDLAESLNFSVEAIGRQREGDVAAHEPALLAVLPW